MDKLYSIATEQGVLCSFMTLSDGIDQLIEKAKTEWFFAQRHQVIFTAIKAIHDRGENIDVLLVQDEINKRIEDRQQVPEEYLQELMGAPVVISTLEEHLDKLKRLSVRRAYADVARLMQGMAMDFTTSVDDLMTKAQNLLADVNHTDDSGNLRSAFELVGNLYVDIAETMEARAKGQYIETGIRTGFIALDNKIGTLERGNLIIIGARPSMGKTTFIQNIMADMAVNQDLSVLFMSCEMTDEEISKRLTSGLSGIPLKKIKAKHIEQDDWPLFMQASEALKTAKLAVNDKSNASLSDIRESARQLKFKHGRIDAIFVDYLQLMKSPVKSDNKVVEVGAISMGLKAIAKEFDCVVVALSQLSRQLENRPNKRPVNSDLRESGQIEQDADVILFIYRDEVYNKDTKQPGVAEIIVGKCRDGETGTTYLATDLARASFCELDAKYYESMGGGV